MLETSCGCVLIMTFVILPVQDSFWQNRAATLPPRWKAFAASHTLIPSFMTDIFPAAHAITVGLLGTIMALFPYRIPTSSHPFWCSVVNPAQVNPMFPLRWRCDAFRCSFRPFPSFIYGGSGMLIGIHRAMWYVGRERFPRPNSRRLT